MYHVHLIDHRNINTASREQGMDYMILWHESCKEELSDEGEELTQIRDNE